MPRFRLRRWQSGEVGTGTETTAADETARATAASERDDELLASYATALADEIQRTLPGWVHAAVAARTGGTVPAELADAVTQAGADAAEEVGGQIRSLLALDIDEQWTNPLTLIRTAIKYPNQILRDACVPTINRDAQAKRFHPDDVYGLIPSSFADLGPTANDLGLSWGAAKAHVHLRRRRAEEVA